jgi:EmrB/QacA subfamily drug resistance transporter
VPVKHAQKQKGEETTVSSTNALTGRANVPDAQAGSGNRRLGLALLVIATAQLMVVLDSAIVNVALPHIQHALGFSGNGLEWVVTAYAVTFGGLLLLGGRSGDLLGRRRIFIAGLLVFSAASLFGGFANSEAWLLASRAAQGVGGAMIAPTALALITTTFPEGAQRNRAMGVYAAMSGGGAAIGLIAGGLLTTYLSWRWVFFVNVPIGILTALLARSVIAESTRRRGRFDLPGALTATLGVALLVYGLSNASTDQAGISHWGDTKVVVSLVAAVVLLASFALIEWRSKHALVPPRVLENRSRVGAYVVMLALATAMFGVFFFLTIFVQEVLGYSALRSGLAFLPFATMIVVMSGIMSQLVARVGARPLLLAGAAVAATGLFWFSQITVHSSYVGGLLGPMLVTSAGFGMIFVPLSLVALNKVRGEDSGVAASLLNTGQQVGGAIGLATLGTVTWSAVSTNIKSQTAAGNALSGSVLHHALAVGISDGFLLASGIVVLGIGVAAALIRLRRSDLAGAERIQVPDTAAELDGEAELEAVISE